LKRRFPHVIFENCASGGGRTDLGLMKHFHHTWVSDWQRAPHSLLITNGMTMALPPERVDRLFAGMNCHPFGSLDLQMRNTMLGHMTLNVIAPADAEPNSQQMAFVRHSTDIYKRFIRPFLPTASIYHHTPEAWQSMESGILAMEITSADKRRGAATVYSLPGVKAESYRFIPKGLDASLNYKVTLDNSGGTFTLSGYALQNEGILLRIPSALSSELLLFEAIE
jgi:alpha-galactosidase